MNFFHPAWIRASQAFRHWQILLAGLLAGVDFWNITTDFQFKSLFVFSNFFAEKLEKAIPYDHKTIIPILIKTYSELGQLYNRQKLHEQA